MTKDVLDNEVGVSGALTETGLDAKAKSRLVSAFDRLLGNAVDWLNPGMERRAARTRALSEAEGQIISAAAKVVSEQVAVSPELAKRVLENQATAAVRRQENKDGVVKMAIQDLRSDPPSTEQNLSSSDELSDQFLTRFERYAEEATTDTLRERWGKILASEVRSPNTFSQKTLRIVDELDFETAELFQRIVANKLLKYIPKHLSGEIKLSDLIVLVQAGLLVEPGITGHTLHLTKVDWLAPNTQRHTIRFKNYGIARDSDLSFQQAKYIRRKGDNLAFEIYVLTTAGEAISRILEIDEEANCRRLLECLNDGQENGGFFLTELLEDGNWHLKE